MKEEIIRKYIEAHEEIKIYPLLRLEATKHQEDFDLVCKNKREYVDRVYNQQEIYTLLRSLGYDAPELEDLINFYIAKKIYPGLNPGEYVERKYRISTKNGDVVRVISRFNEMYTDPDLHVGCCISVNCTPRYVLYKDLELVSFNV